MPSIKKIYVEDFGALETQALKIDYLRFNLKSDLSDNEIATLATYFRRVGFSSYKKERDTSKERSKIFTDKDFVVTFVLSTPYYKGTHLEFAGRSAKRLYALIKEKKFNWNKLKQYGAFLRRIDTYYSRSQEPTDKISNNKFLEANLNQFKSVLPNNNLEYRKNRSGQTTAVGHRTSDKYYRIYMKGDCLRFEFEHKHRPTLNLYDRFLEASQFEPLEQRLSYEFFKQTYRLFKYSHEPEKVEWLARCLRPLQTRNELGSKETKINFHYVYKSPMRQAQKEDLIKLFQLIAYVETLESYEMGKLDAKFRKYTFPVREFVKFTHGGRKVNFRQVGKAAVFFDALKNNIVMNFLSDHYYRMLVSIPESKVSKVNQRWIATVWVADELFDYLEPFLFSDHFKGKRMTTYEFAVLFEIIQKFSVDKIGKEFNISRFLDSYTYQLGGARRKKMKEWFIFYFNKLYQEGKIQEQVVFPLLSESNPKRLIKVFDLNLTRLIEPFVVYEALEVSFLNKKIKI